MTEDLIPFVLAKKLKEKGFREKCIATYDIGDDEFDFNNYVLRVAYQMNVTAKDCLRLFNDTNTGLIDAPTISQVLKWLREEKKIHISIDFFLFNGKTELWWVFEIRNIQDSSTYDIYVETKRKSFNEAALAGIEYCLDNLV